MDILRALQPLTGKGRYVFPDARSRERCMSENTVNGGLRRLGWSGSEMTGHGFRSMASTLLNEQGVTPRCEFLRFTDLNSYTRLMPFPRFVACSRSPTNYVRYPSAGCRRR